MRLVICEKSKELITGAPHAGEFESVADAKTLRRPAPGVLSTDLVIESEAGDLIAYRPGIRPWVDCADQIMSS